MRSCLLSVSKPAEQGAACQYLLFSLCGAFLSLHPQLRQPHLFLCLSLFSCISMCDRDRVCQYVCVPAPVSVFVRVFARLSVCPVVTKAKQKDSATTTKTIYMSDRPSIQLEYLEVPRGTYCWNNQK